MTTVTALRRTQSLPNVLADSQAVPPHPLDASLQQTLRDQANQWDRQIAQSPLAHVLALAHSKGNYLPREVQFEVPGPLQSDAIKPRATMIAVQGLVPARVSPARVEALQKELQAIYGRTARTADGANADYIGALASVPDDLVLVLSYSRGDEHFSITCGDPKVTASMQSTVKPLAYAQAAATHGPDAVGRKIGCEGTQDYPFSTALTTHNARQPDAVAASKAATDPAHTAAFTDTLLAAAGMAPEPARALNAMFNIGALQAAALGRSQVQAADGGAPLELGDLGRTFHLMRLFQRLACRDGGEVPCAIDPDIYGSELFDSPRNQLYANVAAQHIHPEKTPAQQREFANDTMRAYIASCSLRVHPRDLTQAYATLANGGYNAATGEQVVSQDVANAVLAQMRAAGFYEQTAQLAQQLPGWVGKSGVSGQTVLCDPASGFTIGCYSPRLNEAGNSDRAMKAFEALATSPALHTLQAELASGR